jgi:hypothetical protein
MMAMSEPTAERTSAFTPVEHAMAMVAGNLLLLNGEEIFGRPSAATRAAVKAVVGPKCMLDILNHVKKVRSWEELFPPGEPRRRRRTNGST